MVTMGVEKIFYPLIPRRRAEVCLDDLRVDIL